MALIDQYNLSAIVTFQERVQAALLNYITGTVNAEVANDQATLTVTGSPTGGSFTLGGGPLTGAVAPAWNDTAQVLASRLNAALATGNTCVCTGGPFPGTQVIVTWLGNLSNSPQLVLTLNANSLTGGSGPSVTIGHNVGVAVANHAARAALASKIVASPISFGQLIANAVAADATVQTDYTGGGNSQASVTDAHIAAAVGNTFNLYI